MLATQRQTRGCTKDIMQAPYAISWLNDVLLRLFPQVPEAGGGKYADIAFFEGLVHTLRVL